mmetsp:Transcript_16777/g.52272  ORF Transcript_16777/g.52272 Transcript_16777/m.52272 type:complete len:724 (-) Transcript_16777:826-2997(-)
MRVDRAELESVPLRDDAAKSDGLSEVGHRIPQVRRRLAAVLQGERGDGPHLEGAGDRAARRGRGATRKQPRGPGRQVAHPRRDPRHRGPGHDDARRRGQGEATEVGLGRPDGEAGQGQTRLDEARERPPVFARVVARVVSGTERNGFGGGVRIFGARRGAAGGPRGGGSPRGGRGGEGSAQGRARRATVAPRGGTKRDGGDAEPGRGPPERNRTISKRVRVHIPRAVRGAAARGLDTPSAVRGAAAATAWIFRRRFAARRQRAIVKRGIFRDADAAIIERVQTSRGDAARIRPRGARTRATLLRVRSAPADSPEAVVGAGRAARDAGQGAPGEVKSAEAGRGGKHRAEFSRHGGGGAAEKRGGAGRRGRQGAAGRAREHVRDGGGDALLESGDPREGARGLAAPGEVARRARPLAAEDAQRLQAHDVQLRIIAQRPERGRRRRRARRPVAPVHRRPVGRDALPDLVPPGRRDGHDAHALRLDGALLGPGAARAGLQVRPQGLQGPEEADRGGEGASSPGVHGRRREEGPRGVQRSAEIHRFGDGQTHVAALPRESAGQPAREAPLHARMLDGRAGRAGGRVVDQGRGRDAQEEEKVRRRGLARKRWGAGRDEESGRRSNGPDRGAGSGLRARFVETKGGDGAAGRVGRMRRVFSPAEGPRDGRGVALRARHVPKGVGRAVVGRAPVHGATPDVGAGPRRVRFRGRSRGLLQFGGPGRGRVREG